MPNNGREQERIQQPAEKNTISIGAMPFAKEVAHAFGELETGYREGLYKFFGKGLTSYKKFRKDADGYKELLQQENISALREKPDVMVTSRLVLYYLTGARDDPERNTASKYARIVDYLHAERIEDAAVAAYVRKEGGMDAILKKARGHEAAKSSGKSEDEMVRDDDQSLERVEGRDEALSGAPPSEDGSDELFDEAKDLGIRVDSKARMHVLSEKLRLNKVFYLKCKKVRTLPGGGVRILGILAKGPSA